MTKYEQFQHRMVEEEFASLLKMHSIVKNRGIPVKQVNAEDQYLIISGFFSSLFEMIIHDCSKEQALKSASTLSIFFHNVIRAVVGF